MFSGRVLSRREVRQSCSSREAEKLHVEVAVARAKNSDEASIFWERLGRPGEWSRGAEPPGEIRRRTVGWVSAPGAMPTACPESSWWCRQEAQEAARAQLRYISRRRAKGEPDEALAQERLPEPTRPPELAAQPEEVMSPDRWGLRLSISCFTQARTRGSGGQCRPSRRACGLPSMRRNRGGGRGSSQAARRRSLQRIATSRGGRGSECGIAGIQ